MGGTADGTVAGGSAGELRPYDAYAYAYAYACTCTDGGGLLITRAANVFSSASWRLVIELIVTLPHTLLLIALAP